MNERIKELYRSSRSKESLASQDEYNSANVLLGAEVEKFAELIVRECMSLVSEPGLDMNDTERGILSQIKQHFGVEE